MKLKPNSIVFILRENEWDDSNRVVFLNKYLKFQFDLCADFMVPNSNIHSHILTLECWFNSFTAGLVTKGKIRSSKQQQLRPLISQLSSLTASKFPHFFRNQRQKKLCHWPPEHIPYQSHELNYDLRLFIIIIVTLSL